MWGITRAWSCSLLVKGRHWLLLIENNDFHFIYALIILKQKQDKAELSQNIYVRRAQSLNKSPKSVMYPLGESSWNDSLAGKVKTHEYWSTVLMCSLAVRMANCQSKSVFFHLPCEVLTGEYSPAFFASRWDMWYFVLMNTSRINVCYLGVKEFKRWMSSRLFLSLYQLET